MTTFNFPLGTDSFTPTLFNDITVVNKDHVQDLRNSILLIENALIGLTPFPYSGTNIISSGNNIRKALELLDQNLYTLQQQLGFFYDGYDGYASRIDQIQSQFEAHRIAQGPIDADGYGVHGVSGQVVGTLNSQYLFNKAVDSGSGQVVGPKFVARATIADYSDGYLGQQIQVYGSTGNLNAWIDDLGSAYFAGDLVIEGNRVLKGYDVVEQSLVVDGYSILGNNASLDYLTAYGPFTLIGTSGTTLTVGSTGDIVGNGANVSLGDSTGTLNLNFVQANISTSTNTSISTGSLTVSGPVTLSNDITINGSILMPNNTSITTAGPLNVLGGLFSVQPGITTVGTSSLNITSSTITMNGTSFDGYGNINSYGTAYTLGNNISGATYLFGNSLNGPSSSFVVYANTVIQEQLTIAGSLSALSTITSTGLTVNGSTNLNTGTQQDGYVWTASGSLGAGNWKPSLQWWNTVVVTTTYNASHRDEVFANTSGGSVLINLPHPAVLGNKVRVIDPNGTWGTFSTTVAATATIMGAPTLVLSAPNGWVEFVYNGTQWQVDDLVIGDSITNATTGSVLFVGVAGALQQDNANFFWDNSNNRLGIGTTSPTQTLSIGSTSQFQVDTNGNIVKLNNVTTSFPSTLGTSGQVLTTNGAGVLSWTTVSGGSSQWTTSGSNIYNSNVGNVGIGNVSPGALFDVANKFQVDTNGNIVKLNNVTTSFPSTLGTNGQVLTTNGAGVLSWATSSVSASGSVTINPVTDNTTITLPSAGLLAGDTWTINNLSNFQVSILSSSGAFVDALVGTGYVQYMAKVSAPTLPTDWTDVRHLNTLFSSYIQPTSWTNWNASATLSPRFIAGTSTGAVAYRGGVLASNGKVVFIPRSTTSAIGIYDPIANTFTAGPVTGAVSYLGGVLTPSGKVIFVPLTASAAIGIYDPIANTFTTGPVTGAAQHTGGILTPSGKVIFVPFTASAAIGIYDTMLSVPLDMTKSPWFNKF